MSFVDEYVSRGLTDVVLISSDSREESSGYQDEIDTEVIVAKKNNGFVRATAESIKRFGPRARNRFNFDEVQISESEYLEHAQRGTPRDLSRGSKG